ncbi:hypothetical protein EV1_003170 [Malus domestica]
MPHVNFLNNFCWLSIFSKCSSLWERPNTISKCSIFWEKLKKQSPCLCQYVKNPNLQKLVNFPNAKKVADNCGSPFSTCKT